MFAEEYLRPSQLGEAGFEVSDVALTRRTKLEIQPLYHKAFGDIKGKVSQDNVVDEVFSWVTAM